MTAISVSAKRKDDAAPISAQYDFGDNLAEAVAKFGEDVVFAKFKQSAVIDLQVVIRRWIGTAPEKRRDLQEEVSAWLPDNKVVVRKSTAEKAQDAISSMSADERKELIKKLKAQGLL